MVYISITQVEKSLQKDFFLLKINEKNIYLEKIQKLHRKFLTKLATVHVPLY